MRKVNVGKIADRFIPAPLRHYWDNRGTSPVGYRLMHGAFWSVMGTGVPQMLNLLTSVIVIRSLGREHYGEYSIISTTAGMFTVFAAFGLVIASTKHVAEFRKTDPAKAGRIIALFSMLAVITALTLSVILALSSPWLSGNALAAPHLSTLLQASAGIIFFSSVNSVQMGCLAGLESFRAIAWVNTFYAVILLILLASGGYFFGLPGAVWGTIAAMALSCIITGRKLRLEARQTQVPISFKGSFNELYILLQFSMPALLAGIVYTPANWVCAAMLANLPAGYSEMGIFNAANSWQKAILFLPQCLNMIALPMLSDFHGSQQHRQYRKAFWYNMTLVGISAIAGAVVISLASSLIMMIYGPAFSSGRNVLIILSFSTFLMAISSYISVTLVSKGKIWFSVWFNSLLAVLLIGTGYLMIPLYGAIGYSLAMLTAYFVQTVCMVIYAARFFSRQTVSAP